LPQIDLGWTWGLSVSALALGVVLLLWGRVLSRPFLGLAGGVVGAVLSSSLAKQFNIHPLLAAALAVVVFGAIGAITDRLIWALAGGSMFAFVGVWILLVTCLPLLAAKEQPPPPVNLSTFQIWAEGWWRFAMAGLVATWKDHSDKVLWTLCLSGGLPLATMLMLPRFGRIFMTSMAGTVGIVGGLLLVAARLRSSLWPADWAGYAVPGAVAVALMMFSMVFQYLGAAAEAARAEGEKKEKKDKDAKSEKDAKKASEASKK
jgi:hypothetical protein